MHHHLFIARRERRLKQKDIAALLDIHPVTYNKKENGKSEFELKEAFFLADYFETTVDSLFSKDVTI